MTDTIRCPACRGAKKVPKLGGMIGECNTCKGKGSILMVDKPVKLEAVTVEDVISKDLINAVADSVPASDINPYKDITNHGKLTVEVLKPVDPDIKVDGKRALYKRKKA